MSHQPERREKNCLNCGAQVHGRFCHVCGQENIVTHQSFWSITKHFVFDVLHFDGKFFHTVLYIFTKPGFVSKQYVEGKRISFLDPIRMYLFTSALFFLIFFSFNSIKPGTGKEQASLPNKSRVELVNNIQAKLKKHPGDSLLQRRLAILQDTSKPLDLDSMDFGKSFFSFGDRKYESVQQYDSVQSALPQSEKDGWLERRLKRQSIKVNEKYSSEEITSIYLETFLHKLPYLLFLSLPFFALILKALYSRRKNFYYSDHAVFTLYHYIFSFILLLIISGVAGLRSLTEWGVLGFLLTVLMLAWPVYLYIEMKNFYQQGWAKTLGKFLLLNFAGSIILVLLFILFLLFSIFQM